MISQEKFERMKFEEARKAKKAAVRITTFHRNAAPIKQTVIRRSDMMDRWKRAVLFRDGYTCQVCGKRGVPVDAHHIVPFAEIMKKHGITSDAEAVECAELWDVANGRTLCKKCHEAEHC